MPSRNLDAALANPQGMSDADLVDAVRQSLLKWQAYPQIHGSLRWSRNGITALREIEVRMQRPC